MVAVPAADAPALRKRAVEGLGGPDSDETMDLLLTLVRCRWRWASRLLAERLDVLLASEAEEMVWECIYELGDPSLLPAVLEAWRPGEPMIADTGVFLARLGDRLDEVPAAVRAEAMEEAGRRIEVRAQLGRGELPLHASEPLRLRLQCTACRQTWTYEVDRVTVNPDVLDRSGDGSASPADGDGFVLSRIVVCKGCGARDEYRLTRSARTGILAGLLAQGMGAADPESARVTLAVSGLWDGSVLRRPSQGIEHLRALAEEQPERGEGWRRLGNLCDRYGLDDEAEDAWRRAAADPGEVEAPYILAGLRYDQADLQEALDFAFTALERMPKAELAEDLRATIAIGLCGMLSEVAPAIRPPIALRATWLGAKTRGRQVVHVSAADLRSIPDWGRLAELIGDGFFMDLGFTGELPEDDEPQLVSLLRGRRSRTVTVRSGPKVGRNDPCPCGSGRKHKRCCMKGK